jgi:hypothetical protein
METFLTAKRGKQTTKRRGKIFGRENRRRRRSGKIDNQRLGQWEEEKGELLNQ